MSETYADPPPAQTGWVGWIVFAAVMMIIAGSLNVFYGIVAAVNDEWVGWTNGDAVYLDISQWGWVHIILGAVVLLSGIGLLSGNILARIGRGRRRLAEPDRQLLLHPRLSPLVAHRDHHRRARHLGPHRARARDENALRRPTGRRR